MSCVLCLSISRFASLRYGILRLLSGCGNLANVLSIHEHRVVEAVEAKYETFLNEAFSSVHFEHQTIGIKKDFDMALIFYCSIGRKSFPWFENSLHHDYLISYISYMASIR